MRGRELTENKAQRFRAVVIFKNEQVGLILFGPTPNYLETHYDTSFNQLYGPDSELDQTDKVKEIQLQKWDGISCAGEWKAMKAVPVPVAIPLPVAIRRKVIEEHSKGPGLHGIE